MGRRVGKIISIRGDQLLRALDILQTIAGSTESENAAAYRERRRFGGNLGDIWSQAHTLYYNEGMTLGFEPVHELLRFMRQPAVAEFSLMHIIERFIDDFDWNELLDVVDQTAWLNFLLHARTPNDGTAIPVEAAEPTPDPH